MIHELSKSFFLHALAFCACWIVLASHYENALIVSESSTLQLTLIPAKESVKSLSITSAQKMKVPSSFRTLPTPILANSNSNTSLLNSLLPNSLSAPSEQNAPVANNTSPNLNNSFFVELRAALEAQKEYPAVARSRHQSGRVDVAFVLTKTGGLEEIQIHHPSEFEKLNEAALLTVNRLGHFRAIPDDISKTALHLVIPIEFKLD